MAARYDLENSSRSHARTQERFVRSLLDEHFTDLPQGSRVLEIGPGRGYFGQECRRREYSYRGVEASRVLLEHLRRMELDVVPGEAPPIPAEDSSYDLVYAGMVLEHMQSHEHAAGLVDEIGRVLAPGGNTCLFFPNAYASGRQFWEMDPTHGYFTTPRRVSRLCEMAGLEVRRIERSLGWYWTRSNPAHHVLRLLVNTAGIPLNAHILDSICSSLRLDGILWKLRKTFFESVLVIAQRPNGTS